MASKRPASEPGAGSEAAKVKGYGMNPVGLSAGDVEM